MERRRRFGTCQHASASGRSDSKATPHGGAGRRAAPRTDVRSGAGRRQPTAAAIEAQPRPGVAVLQPGRRRGPIPRLVHPGSPDIRASIRRKHPPTPGGCREPRHRAPGESGDGAGFRSRRWSSGWGRLGLCTSSSAPRNQRAVRRPEDLPHLRLLYLDTDPGAAQTAVPGASAGAAPAKRGACSPSCNRRSHYLTARARCRRGAVAAPRDRSTSCREPGMQTSAGVRALGRLALVDHYRTSRQALEAELETCLTGDRCCKPRRRPAGHAQPPARLRRRRLAGGTGSGMFLDVAYLLFRHVLRRIGRRTRKSLASS